MTKEEVLKKTYSEGIKARGVESIFPKSFPQAYEEFALKAMDTYARQEAKTEAIGFTLWSDKNATQVNADRWKTGIDNWFKVHTTEQLYDLYQQQKQKR